MKHSVCLLLALVGTALGACPAGSVASINGNPLCYAFYSVPQQFTDAEQLCTDVGGHLASIDNGFTNVFLTEQAQKIFQRVNSSTFWIGANDLASPGVWSWTDGKPFSYNDWSNGQPSSGDCGGVAIANGAWATDSCFAKKPFICTTPAVTGPNCPASCDSGWSVFNMSCYKVSFNKDWNDAEADCVTNGGHLASIHSIQEEIFVSTLARTGLDSDTKKQPWIGLHSPDGSNWFWSDNTKLDYTDWATKQPGSGACGQIFADKSPWPQDAGLYEKWFSMDCSKSSRAYVCKKPAKH